MAIFVLVAYTRRSSDQRYTGVKQVICIGQQGLSMRLRSHADSLTPVTCQHSDRDQMPRRDINAVVRVPHMLAAKAHTKRGY